jgi:protein-S-isoprenylcysteine O-methyltransferase Ste14
MSVYGMLVLGCWLVFAVVWFTMGLTAKPSTGGFAGGRGLLLRLALAVVAAVLVRAGHLDLGAEAFAATGHPLMRTMGVLLTAAGIGFAVWARLHLGRNWGMPMTMRAEPELVTSGPYAFVRHPIYTGMLLALLGSGLVAGPLWFVIFAAALVYFTYSAVNEERAMAERFPAAYPGYRARTRMLIPFLF